MADDMKKPALALAIGKSEPVDDDMDGKPDDESSEDYSEAAGEVFDMLKADDKAGFAQAMKALVMSCK